MRERAMAWCVHAFTASGAVLAWLALDAVDRGDVREAFLWLAAAVAIDVVDGGLARTVRVKEVLPWFDGTRLDDIVDYLTFVFVPAWMVWRLDLVPQAVGPFVAGAMLLSSAYGFSRTDAKTADHFFTGFPSYWNIVVLYLVVLHLQPAVNAAVLLFFTALVFVPIRYVYPSRTPTLFLLTNALGAIWGAAMISLIWTLPRVHQPLLVLSFVFPVYYTGLSLWLEAKRRRRDEAAAPVRG